MRSWESPEDDWIAQTGRPRAEVVAEIEADERRAEETAPADVAYLRRQAKRAADYFGVGPEDAA